MASVASDIAGIESAKKDAATVRADGERIRDPIEGVSVRRALTHADERGTLTEILDDRWSFTDDEELERGTHLRQRASHRERHELGVPVRRDEDRRVRHRADRCRVG